MIPAAARSCSSRTQAAGAAGLDARQRAEVAFYQAIAARTRGDEAAAAAGFARALLADPTFRPALIATMA